MYWARLPILGREATKMDALLLELDVFAESDELTQEDLETIETHAEAEGVFGYIGNSFRNYLTDDWLLAVANWLGWDRPKLAEWTQSLHGRFAVEECPHSLTEMASLMVADFGIPADV